jgi:succinyl-diaminopimelate desuccinylase
MSTTRLRERLAELTLELVRIPSVTGAERELAHHIERWALSAIHVGRDDIIRQGNNILIGQPDGRRPCVALVGHLDTVPPAIAQTPTADERRIVGRGASDMKGGLAVMLALVEELELRNLPFNVILVFYDREEGPYEENGLGSLLDRLEILRAVDLAVVLEPTANTLQLGCLGALHARVTFTGKTAHSARPWEGENAIHKAGALLQRLHGLAPREVNVGTLVFRETLSVTLAKGGVARNVIPDRFELNLNYRFAPAGDPAKAVRVAQSTVRALVPDAKVELVDVAPPGPVPIDNPIVDHLRQHAELTVAAKEAWTDVGRLALYGIEAVNFGPGDPALAHQALEYVEIDALVRAYEVLATCLKAPLVMP